MRKFLIILCLCLIVACGKETETSDKTVSGDMHVIPVKSTTGKFGSPLKFTSVDLEGNAVTEDIFKNADVTLVNIWATWCGPCRQELSDLANIAKKYSNLGYQVVGIVHDAIEGSDSMSDAIAILKDAGCEYVNIANDPSMAGIFADLDAFPTTFFVDKDGNLIGSEYIGAMSEKIFDSRFEDAIKQVK